MTLAHPPVEDRLVALVADAPRGPRRDGLYAVWLVVRAVEGCLPPAPVSRRNHRRRLLALETRLGGLALPAPLRRALTTARHHLEPGTPGAAAIVLRELVAPAREVLGVEAADALAAAARAPARHSSPRRRAASPNGPASSRSSSAWTSSARVTWPATPSRRASRRSTRSWAAACGGATWSCWEATWAPASRRSGSASRCAWRSRAPATELTRASLGAAAVRLRGLPLSILPLAADDFEAMAGRLDAQRQLGLVIVDYLQLVPPPAGAVRGTQDEEIAVSLRRLKAMALERQVSCLVLAQLSRFDPGRPDHRPTLDDYGHLGSVKQHADVVLSLYRPDMYDPGRGVEGATELVVSKNRNGPTGFVDLYFYRRWMRFEDMLDPDR
jgi:hypothetical protein